MVLAGVGRPRRSSKTTRSSGGRHSAPGVRRPRRAGPRASGAGQPRSLRSGATAAAEVGVGPFPVVRPFPIDGFPGDVEQLKLFGAGELTLGENGQRPQAQCPRCRHRLVKRTVQRPLRPPPPFGPAVGPRLLDELQGVGVGPLAQDKVADEGGHKATEQDCQRAEGAHNLPPLGGAGEPDDDRRELEAAWDSQDQPKPGHRPGGASGAVRIVRVRKGTRICGNVHGTMGTT